MKNFEKNVLIILSLHRWPVCDCSFSGMPLPNCHIVAECICGGQFWKWSWQQTVPIWHWQVWGINLSMKFLKSPLIYLLYCPFFTSAEAKLYLFAVVYCPTPTLPPHSLIYFISFNYFIFVSFGGKPFSVFRNWFPSNWLGENKI
jgi:hypothetical protein